MSNFDEFIKKYDRDIKKLYEKIKKLENKFNEMGFEDESVMGVVTELDNRVIKLEKIHGIKYNKDEQDSQIETRSKAKKMKNIKEEIPVKRQNSHDSDIFETVADCYHELEQYEEEINHYESILSTKFVSWIYHRYENCYYEQQEYDKALEICTREIQEAPEAMKADAYCNRGKFKEKINDYKGALIDYKKALEIEPGSIRANRNIEEFKDWLEYWEIDTETMDEILSLISS